MTKNDPLRPVIQWTTPTDMADCAGGHVTDEKAVGDHWAKGDVYARIVAALGRMSKSLDAVTLEDLAPVDHFHARGLPATVELADRLPIRAGQHIVDIGCGLGG